MGVGCTTANEGISSLSWIPSTLQWKHPPLRWEKTVCLTSAHLGNPWERAERSHMQGAADPRGEGVFVEALVCVLLPSVRWACMCCVCSVLRIYLPFLPSDFWNRALLPFLHLVRHICFNAVKAEFTSKKTGFSCGFVSPLKSQLLQRWLVWLLMTMLKYQQNLKKIYQSKLHFFYHSEEKNL